MRTTGAWIVGILCAYELAALTTRRTPTISRVSWQMRKHPLGAAVVVGALSALAWHLLLDDETQATELSTQ